MRKKGFTLIELLVAIGILAILSTLVMANINSARSRGRDAKRKADLNQVKTALRLYYNDNQSYPADDDAGGINGAGWGSQWTVSGNIYMNKLPQDPLYDADDSPEWSYYYGQSNDDKYILKACLENTNDPDSADFMQCSIQNLGETASIDCESACYIITQD